MPKFTFVLVIVGLAVVQGLPAFDDDVAAAAAAGNWEKVHQLLSKTFNHDFKFGPFPNTGDVRSLKPHSGGHVYAESDVNFKTSSNYNGKVEQKSGGHRVVNEDGTVREYDYKPTFK